VNRQAIFNDDADREYIVQSEVCELRHNTLALKVLSRTSPLLERPRC
jgi:hypothetical protein